VNEHTGTGHAKQVDLGMAAMTAMTLREAQDRQVVRMALSEESVKKKAKNAQNRHK